MCMFEKFLTVAIPCNSSHNSYQIPANVVAAMQIDSEFLEHLSVHSLVVFKKCRYIVWLNQIESHLQG